VLEERRSLSSMYERLNFSEKTQLLVEGIRSSGPSRAVGSGKSNVRGRYPSRKMGVTIQFESHRNELPAIFELEHDLDVIEYYDQPLSITIEYQGMNKRWIRVLHTPDFFVIRERAAGWEECKTEEELLSLSERNPNRYRKDEDGVWRCPPGEAYATPLGFYYRLRTSAEINWTFQRNIQFLEDYFRIDAPVVAQAAREAVTMIIASEPNITLDQLYKSAEGKANRDDIHMMIAHREIFVALSAAPLPEPDLVRVFPDEETSVAYRNLIDAVHDSAAHKLRHVDLSKSERVLWGNRSWTILNTNEETVGLLGDGNEFREVPRTVFEELVKKGKITGLQDGNTTLFSAEAMERFRRANSQAYREANRRADFVQARLSGDQVDKEIVGERTIRRWVSSFRAAESRWGCGYLGLLPVPRSGNRKGRLPFATVALLDKFIDEDYETIKHKRKYEVYAAYLRACDKAGLIAASYKTFCATAKRRSRYQQTLQREGKRAAYRDKPFCWYLDQTTPRHGDRPFEIVHIDHTELDEELVCSQTGRKLGKCWATIATDAFSRRFLAVYMSYDPPSYRSCMMILREIVRRFGKFPQMIIVDGGAEFESVYFETLLARYECTKKTRPPAEARFGSVCERLFGTTNTMFIHNLRGNTQLMKNARQVTKSINPKHLAVWALGDLYSRFREFAYELYDTLTHPSLGTTPREAFALGIKHGGMRSHRMVHYSEDFQLFTLPTTRKGTAKVRSGKGVKINHIYYWSEAFCSPNVERKNVEVRYDPWNAGIAYAYVGGRWVECKSQYWAILRGRSERELMLATRELRRRQCLHTQEVFTVTARRLAEFLESLEAQEVLLEQRLRDQEARRILASVPRPATEALEADDARSPAAASVTVLPVGTQERSHGQPNITDRHNRRRTVYGRF
jgi:putative transposase